MTVGVDLATKILSEATEDFFQETDGETPLGLMGAEMANLLHDCIFDSIVRNLDN